MLVLVGFGISTGELIGGGQASCKRGCALGDNVAVGRMGYIVEERESLFLVVKTE